MCALIAMAVYDTEENNRTDMTLQTLRSLLHTVDFTKHRLIISDNGSCQATKDLYGKLIHDFANFEPGQGIVIYNGENLGTAEAINRAWKHRNPGENAIKMDNDVVIHKSGWVDELEEAISRDARIGIIGLKRKDCWETPWHPDPNIKSELIMLPHETGQRWIIVERANHIIGTCQMYSSALLNKIGYLYQPKLYGYDDVLASHRSHIAGFMNCFLPHFEIEHIDPGASPYQSWKEAHAGECTADMIATFKEYVNGTKPIYYNPFN